MTDAAPTAQEPTPVLSPEELERERRAGRLAGAGTIAAAVLFAIGGIWQLAANRGAPSGKHKEAQQLLFAHDHNAALTGAATVQAVSLFLMVCATLYLYRAIKTRRPQEPRIVLVTGTIGPIAFGVASLGAAIAIGHIASDFVTHADQSNQAAKDALKGSAYDVVQGFGLFAVLSFVFWFVKGSYDAMRVGLLSRFMGVVGMAIGPAILFKIGPLILPFWLLALGLMFLRVWPGQLPEAWRTGRATEWHGFGGQSPLPPEALEAGGERNGDVAAVGDGVGPAGEAVEQASPSLRKRKRRS